jgi:oligosaccharide repeat unit polymerase
MSYDNDLLYAATKYLDSSYFNGSYLLDALVILVSFLLGYFVPKVRTNAQGSVFDYGSFQTSSPSLLAIILCVLISYFAALAVASGGGIFTGYSTYNMSVLGPFSTSAFLSAWFINYFSKKQIRFLFAAIFVFCSVLLLGWGSRMFFALSFLALMLGLVAKNKKLLKSLHFYSLITIFGLLLIAVGIVRDGGGEITGDKLLAIFFAEPLFTSISGSLYLENSGERPAFGIPNDLFASVIHFVPSAIYPGKMQLIGEITHNEDVVSPFGGKSLIVSLYSNFGFFYPVFIAFIGFYYRVLYRKAQNSVFFRATYFSALPLLLFLFFRENLITVIKVMFFNGLAVPTFISLFLIWLSPRSLSEIRNGLFNNRGRGESALEKRVTATARFRRP